MNFNLADYQWAAIKEWKSKLPKSDEVGAIAGRYTYEFTPTTLGMVIKVNDAISGEVLDLTDYDHW